MAIKWVDYTKVSIQSVEEAELIVADMERVLSELKATIELIKLVSPGAGRGLKTPASSI